MRRFIADHQGYGINIEQNALNATSTDYIETVNPVPVKTYPMSKPICAAFCVLMLLGSHSLIAQELIGRNPAKTIPSFTR